MGPESQPEPNTVSGEVDRVPPLPLLVIVSGAPGSGKTTLARRLAHRLELPHLNRDTFYRGIGLTEGTVPSPVRNAEAFYASIAGLLRSGVSTIMDMTTYRGTTEDHLAKAVLPHGRAIVIHCRTPIALERFRARQSARDGEDSERFARGMALATDVQAVVVDPPQLDLPVLEVETTAGYRPGLERIVSFILDHAHPGVARDRLPLGGGEELAQLLRQLGDELRVLAETGLSWSQDNPYDRERYSQARRLAARLFAVADERDGEEIERSVFEVLTHLAPLPVADAAIFDEEGRILLIRRADDGLWAMPGGGYEMGETPAEGAVREAREETGVEVEVVDLIGVYDSRYCGTRSSLQLFQFVFLCRVRATGQATTPHEVTDMAWFGEEELPPLSPGHTVRVPDAFGFLRTCRVVFDLLGTQAASLEETGS